MTCVDPAHPPWLWEMEAYRRRSDDLGSARFGGGFTRAGFGVLAERFVVTMDEAGFVVCQKSVPMQNQIHAHHDADIHPCR